MNELEYPIKQLNQIVGFLDVSDEEVYNTIKEHDRFNMDLSIEELYEYQYENFKNHITSSSLILGFTHFEDFLTKMISKILFIVPSKNKIKVTIDEFEQFGEEDYRKKLGDKQAKRLKFAEKVDFVK